MTATATQTARFDPDKTRQQMRLLGLPDTAEDVAEDELDRNVVEVRILAEKGPRAAGYFTHADALIEALRPWALDPETDTIFVCLNEPDPRLLRRYANRMEPPSPRHRGVPKFTTSDKDIRRRRWLLIDIDVDRPAGVSASDKERESSRSLGVDIYRWLVAQGIPQCSLATLTSGNGYYILVRVDLANGEAEKTLCKAFLEALADRFDTDHAHIDRTTFNASRIAALCGTMKGKGDNTSEAPHRMVAPSRFPEEMAAAPMEILQAIAAPAMPKATMGSMGGTYAAGAGSLGPFPMEEFIARNNLSAGPPMSYQGGQKWQVDCPFNTDHKSPDAVLFVTSDGKPGFRCSHSSCAGRDMKALAGHLGDHETLKRFVPKNYTNAGKGTDKTDKTPPRRPFVGFVSSSGEESENSYPGFDGSPRPICVDLAPVPPLPANMLPESLRAWLSDIAERVGCPLEYPTAAALVALGAVIGRRVGIRPKRQDDWTVVPNLWGAIVGRPGTLKSPAIAEALKPLHRMEAEARKVHEAQVEAHQADALVAKARAAAAQDELKKEARKPGATQARLRELAVDAVVGDMDSPPTMERFLVNDTTVEALGERLSENPNGLMVFRDELTGLLRGLERQGHEQDRAFYLEGWNSGPYTVDRIGRGTVHIPAVTLSLFGGIQPGPLSAWLRNSGMGEASDGFSSRLQILFYPDPPRQFRNVDRWPNSDAKSDAFKMFQFLGTLTPADIGAELDPDGGVPFLHFAHDAQDAFDAWRVDLENRILAGQDLPMLIEHLAKYRSLLPSLALIFHLAQTGRGPVSLAALEYARLWLDLLEAHAHRLYQSVMNADPEAASLLASRLKPQESLPNPFKARDVQRKGWTGLTTPDEVDRALGLLEERGWILAVDHQPMGENGQPSGRPTTLYYKHPDLLAGTDKTDERSAP